MTRILYFCPDFPQPSGGTKTLYRHVARLRRQGFEAYIVHQRRGFVLIWHGYDAPVLWLEDKPPLGADDVLVFPEVMADYIRKTRGFAGQRVVIALSWQPQYYRLRPGERWQDHGIARVITKSPLVKRYLEWSMGIEVTLIPEFVDPALYYFQPKAKALKIAYLTRKDQSGEWLRGVLQRKGAPFDAYTWQPLRELDEATYAQHLREASVFMTTTLQEAMHVSVLEAMACGCLVVGFAGVGGSTYMVGEGPAQNCVLVDNGNLPRLGQMLEEVLPALAADRSQYGGIIANAVATARRYQDAEAETNALRAFFNDLATRS